MNALLVPVTCICMGPDDLVSFCMDTMKIADALLPHGIHSVAVCVCVSV